jgi:hypothetical protein
MTRRFWMWCCAWTLGTLASAGISRRLRGDEQQATLNELLRSVLKCRRPVEFAYINLVAAKVEAGELPEALVLSMMKWAQKRARQESGSGRRKTDIPFPYFQQGLFLRAREIGVDLPEFTVDIGP